MSNKRKTSTIPNLPQDLVTDVLARLPVKSLQKFRCVCKSWDLRIGKDNYLTSQQLKYSRQRSPIPNKPGLFTMLFSRQYSRIPSFLVSREYTFGYTIENDDKVHNFDQLLNQQLVEGGFTNKTRITNSCDGLVGIYSLDNKFCVVNPRIRKVQVLPEGSSHKCVTGLTAGLGFDSLTEKYKVVRLFHRESIRNKRVGIGCEVLSLADDESRSWRLVDNPPSKPFRGSLPVVVDGFMYWTLRGDLELGIVALSFNLSTEKFGLVKHPEGARPSRSLLWVTQLQGCLCVADTFGGCTDLWLLKDCRNNEWIKQYTINVAKLYEVNKDFRIRPVAIDDGRIMLHRPFGWRDYYDPKTQCFYRREKIADGDHKEWITPYTESMIWPWLR